MKFLYFDIETTGTRFWKSGIHQLSGLVEIDGEVKEAFDFRVRPNPNAIIEDAALKVSGATREQIAQYQPMNEIFLLFKTILAKYVDPYNKRDKFFLIGYNAVRFDNQFLRAWFAQNGDKYFGSWFWSSGIDVMVLAADYLKEHRHEMENFKLRTVANFLGIKIDETKLHDASYDLLIMREIYKKITKP